MTHQEGYEEFTDSQINLLERFVTNTSCNIFALRNLPEVIKGALFSRYSRSRLGLRSLLLKEFVANDEVAFESIVGAGSESKESTQDQMLAIKRAQNFYDRILDGYGDDSIGELGGAHLAIENVSMIATKVLEDCRIGGSPLEKSTRYIYFDQKIQGEYLFYKEPILMTSAYRQIYIDTCNMLFDTYSKLIPSVTELIEERFPRTEEISKAAYTAALRAKVLDCLRGLLPASALTNMGIYGNGRFFESMIRKLHSNNLAELQEIGKKSYEELSKVIPSFVRRSESTHKHCKSGMAFSESMEEQIRAVTAKQEEFPERSLASGVRLVSSDPQGVMKVAAALLYSYSNQGLPELQKHCSELPEEEIASILDSACSSRDNRRHKSPRALEHAEFTFEIVADYGIYRDLQRHRILTQDRQLLTCDYGFYSPAELSGTEILNEYNDALMKAKEVFDTIKDELPEEAQYVVPMAYNIRWYFHVNLRSLQWLCELRSSPAGHPGYRYVAQEMAKAVFDSVPEFERFFKFVDFEGYELGRLQQEERTARKKVESV
ncbi:MAG: thymidylate synthase ThyX [Chlamydiales bacterium]|jgi:thymidylate synthase ThyX